MIQRWLVCVSFILCLASCHKSVRYEQPILSMPKNWKGPFVAKNSPSVENWWEIFEDPLLNECEKKLTQKNWDLYVAIQKVAEARATAGVSKSQLYPQLNAHASYAFFQNFLKIKTLGQTPSPFLQDKITVYAQQYAFPNLFTYELDLWGKFRGQYHAALCKTEAVQDQMKSTLLTLSSECACYYFNLRSLDTMLFLQQQLKSTIEQICRLQKLRLTQGLISEISYCTTEEALHSVQIHIHETQKQREKFENALATLLGEPPSSFRFEKGSLLLKEAPSVPAGIPSTLLLRRPDVMQAEREMASSHSLVNVARANYFPAFNLTSGVGAYSITLQDLLSIKSFLWQAGASLAQFVYDAGKRKNEVEAAKARLKQAQGDYQKIILKALEEVESSLSGVYQENLKYQETQINVTLAKKKASLTLKKWSYGLSNTLELLEEQSQEIQTEQQALESRTMLYQATIQLIKSIGGSW